jgi:hypothetical protein
MREITFVKKTSMKKIFQMTDEEFRSGKWCGDKEMIPDSKFVELEYTARNGILIVRNVQDLKVKSLEKNKGEI